MAIMPWDEFSQTDFYRSQSFSNRRKLQKEYWKDVESQVKAGGGSVSKQDYRDFKNHVIELEKQIVNEQTNQEFSEQDRGILPALREGVKKSFIGKIASDIDKELYSITPEQRGLLSQLQGGVAGAVDSTPAAQEFRPVDEAKEQSGYQYIPETFGERVASNTLSVVTDAPLYYAGGALSRLGLKTGATGASFRAITQTSPRVASILEGASSGAGAFGLHGGLSSLEQNIDRPFQEQAKNVFIDTIKSMGTGAITSLAGTPGRIISESGGVVSKIAGKTAEIAGEGAALLSLHGEITPESAAQTAAELAILNIIGKGKDSLSKSGSPAVAELSGALDTVKKLNVEDSVKDNIISGVVKPGERGYSLKDQIEDATSEIATKLSKASGIEYEIVAENLSKKGMPEFLEKIGKEKRITPDVAEAMSKEELLSAVDSFFAEQVSLSEKRLIEARSEFSKDGVDKDAVAKRIGQNSVEKSLFEQGRDYLSEELFDIYDPQKDYSALEVGDVREAVSRVRSSETFPENPSSIRQAVDVVVNRGIHSFGDVVSKASPAGAELNSMFKSVEKRNEQIGAENANIVKKEIRSVPQKDAELLRLYLDDSVKYKERAAELSPDSRRVIEQSGKNIREILDKYAAWAEELGVSDFRKRTDYFPRMIKDKYIHTEAGRAEFVNEIALDSRAVAEAMKERMGADSVTPSEDGFIVTKGGEKKYIKYSTEQRKQEIRDSIYRYAEERERRYGHFMERTLKNVPEKFIETDPEGVLSSYITRATKRLVEIEHYGIKDQNINRLVSRAITENAENKSLSKEEAIANVQRIQQFAKLMTYKKSESRDVSKFAANVMALQTIRKMPLSTISQYGQGFSPIVRGNLSSYVKAGAWRIASRLGGGRVKALDDFGNEAVLNAQDFHAASGSAHTHITNDYMNRIASDVDTLLSRGAKKLLSINKFKNMDEWNRYKASTTGYFYAQEMIKNVNKILKSDVAQGMSPENQLALVRRKFKGKFAERRLSQMDLNLESILAKGRDSSGKYYLNKRELSDAMRKFEIDTNYRNDFSSLPYIFQTDMGKIVTQFQSYNYHRTKELRDFVGKEALKGNIKPALYLLALVPTVGGGLSTIRSLIAARGLPEDEKKYIFDSVSTLGAIGWMSNVASMSQFGTIPLGPTLDDMLSIGDAIWQSNKRKEDKWIPYMRLLMKQVIPIYGSQLAKSAFEKEETISSSNRSQRRNQRNRRIRTRR